MENPEQSTSERMNKYDNDSIWANTFIGHGINEKHLKCWFSNYKCEHEWQKENLARITVLCRRNNICIALLGDVGNGKTHLATAILKDHIIYQKTPERKKTKSDLGQDHFYYQKKNSPGHYYTMTGLFREYRQLISNSGDENKFMDNIFNLNCLVIDEMQIKSNSEAEQRMFQELIDKRYAMEKQTIFVGNMTRLSFENMLGRRLLDRMFENGLEILIFSDESYRRKRG